MRFVRLHAPDDLVGVPAIGIRTIAYRATATDRDDEPYALRLPTARVTEGYGLQPVAADQTWAPLANLLRQTMRTSTPADRIRSSSSASALSSVISMLT